LPEQQAHQHAAKRDAMPSQLKPFFAAQDGELIGEILMEAASLGLAPASVSRRVGSSCPSTTSDCSCSGAGAADSASPLLAPAASSFFSSVASSSVSGMCGLEVQGSCLSVGSHFAAGSGPSSPVSSMGGNACAEVVVTGGSNLPPGMVSVAGACVGGSVGCVQAMHIDSKPAGPSI
jgi:hypothetical protein